MINKRINRKIKKIPTLFERVFGNYKKVGILPNVAGGMEWVQVEPEDRGDMWHMVAYQNSNGSNL